MNSILFDILTVLVSVWREGEKKSRWAILIAAGLIALGGLVAFLSDFFRYSILMLRPWIWQKIGLALVAIGLVIAVGIYAIHESKEEARKEKKIEEVERRVQENPQETQAAWKLAQDKLESYLNRNLSQVRSIFWLTLLVMVAGFSLICYGAHEAFQQPANFKASVLTTSAGALVSFIGGTFLVIYKATMEQAKDYVAILERINAVGMSVQILETLKDSSGDLRDQTTAEVAKQLLFMYSLNSAGQRVSGNRKARSGAADGADPL